MRKKMVNFSFLLFFFFLGGLGGGGGGGGGWGGDSRICHQIKLLTSGKKNVCTLRSRRCEKYVKKTVCANDIQRFYRVM